MNRGNETRRTGMKRRKKKNKTKYKNKQKQRRRSLLFTMAITKTIIVNAYHAVSNPVKPSKTQ